MFVHQHELNNRLARITSLRQQTKEVEESLNQMEQKFTDLKKDFEKFKAGIKEALEYEEEKK